MQAFHLLGPAPFYTNSFLLISDAGHAVIIDPAAEVQEYDKILKEHNAQLTTILCTHGHYDHVGSAGTLRREHKARLYCEPVDCRGTQLLPLKAADVDIVKYMTPDEGTSHTNEVIVALSGETSAVKTAVMTARAAGLSLLGEMEGEVRGLGESYIK